MDIQFSSNLRTYRKQAGHTRKSLAEAIGYSEKAIEKWERGCSVPSLQIICRLAEIFEIPLEELVFERHGNIQFFLGIDGGGTKTAFRLEDKDGICLAEFTAGPSNPNDIGMERCAEILRTGITAVTAGIDRREVAAFAGIAGGMSDSNATQIQGVLLSQGLGFVSCGSDVDNALELCLHGKDGVVVITGTGCVAFAQENGVRHRVGGWGYLIDGGGSGYHIGRDALEAAYRYLDGRGPCTQLVSAIEDALQKPLIEAVPSVYHGGKRMIASLAPVAFETYRQGDAVATQIIHENVAAVSEMIKQAVSKMQCDDPAVYLCGGLINHTDVIQPLLQRELYTLHFMNDPMVFGAVACARRKYEEYRTEK